MSFRISAPAVITLLAMEAFFSTAGNVISSVGLILSNKQLVNRNGFDFMVVLTGVHFYSSFLCCLLALMFGVLQYKMISNHLYLFRISMASLMSIVFMNLNLAHNSIAFYQISKLCCIPMTLFLESMFGFRKHKLTFSLVLSLSLIVGGMALVSEGEIQYSPAGLVYMALGVVGTSVGQIWFAPLQKELGLNSLQMLFHTSPIIAFCCFMLTPAVEDTKRLMEVDLTAPLMLNLFGSSMLAFFLNLTGYKVLQLTSPLTYMVVGHLKTILVLLFGIVYFDLPSDRVLAGVMLGMLGVIIYHRAVSVSAANPPAAVAVAVAIGDKEGGEGGPTYSNNANNRMGGGHQHHSEHGHRHRHGHAGDRKPAASAVVSRHGQSTHQHVPLSVGPPATATATATSPAATAGEDKSNRKKRGDDRDHTKNTTTVGADYDDDGGEAGGGATTRLFEAAVKKVGDTSTLWRKDASTETKLRMYGLFKYAKQGPCCGGGNTNIRPGMFDPVGQKKWDAWQGVGGDMTQAEAMTAYVQLVSAHIDL